MIRFLALSAVTSLAGPLSAATLHFQAVLTPDAVVPAPGDEDPAGISVASGIADFTLITGEPGGPRLGYTMTFAGLDVSEAMPRPTLTGPDTLIRGIHVHFGALGATGGHALNVYGFPREDDADLIVSGIDSMIEGVWDDADENSGLDGTQGPGDSVALSNALTALNSGGLYVQVHTMAFRAGELRGQITPIPEPSIALLALSAGLVWRRHRSSHQPR